MDSCVLLRLRELQTVAPALAELGGALALVDDAGLLKEAAVAHFHEDAIALHDLVEAPERRLKRLIVFDYDTSHEITFLSIDLVGLGTDGLYPEKGRGGEGMEKSRAFDEANQRPHPTSPIDG
jgi:hypothetical protein